MTRTAMAALGLLFLLPAGCGSDSDSGVIDDAVAAEVSDRIDAIQAAVDTWADATTVEEAHEAAEAAANLVVGPAGPDFGDRDSDGTTSGSNEIGLLPGLDGESGLASAAAVNDCVTRDILGSTADDPAAGWAEMAEAIDSWRPDNNTMPTLLSHPMRIVGWATFALASDDLDEAHRFAGHAQRHVDVARDAMVC